MRLLHHVTLHVNFSATLSLTILDVNDNPPAFSDVDYEFDVTENDIEGTIISAIISATDKDEGSNGEIIFDLVDDKNLMKIDPETGKFAFVVYLKIS